MYRARGVEIMNPLLYGFIALSVYLWALVLHETGHYAVFRYAIKRDVTISIKRVHSQGHRLQIGRPADYSDLSQQQLLQVYFGGVSLGYIPILVASCLWWPAFLLTAPYLYGCKTDLKQIEQLTGG